MNKAYVVHDVLPDETDNEEEVLGALLLEGCDGDLGHLVGQAVAWPDLAHSNDGLEVEPIFSLFETVPAGWEPSVVEVGTVAQENQPAGYHPLVTVTVSDPFGFTYGEEQFSQVRLLYLYAPALPSELGQAVVWIVVLIDEGGLPIGEVLFALKRVEDDLYQTSRIKSHSESDELAPPLRLPKPSDARAAIKTAIKKGLHPIQLTNRE